MKGKNIVALLISLALIVTILSCAPSTPSTPSTPAKPSTPTTPEKPNWPKLTFLTPPGGTSPHTVAVAWTTLATKYVPGLQISIDPAAGAPQAITAYFQGQGDLLYDSANLIGLETPKYLGGKTLASAPLHMATALGSGVQIATTNPNINSITDLKGKKILSKVATGTSNDIIRQKILAAYGMSDDDVTVLSGNNSQHLATQLREGVAEVAIIVLSVGDPAIVELASSKDIRFIPVTPDKVAQFADAIWVVPGVIPAGTYRGQDKDVPAVRIPSSFDARPGTNEDAIYAAVKLFYDHWDEFVKMAPLAKDYVLKDIVAGQFLPFHPGTIKYLKEKGIWNADAEAKQQKILNKPVPAPAAK